MEIQFYTVEQAAKILKAKTNTVRTYCREGKIPAIKVGRGYRVAKADLEKWVQERKKGQVVFKEEEQKLVEAEAKYRDLFENASDAIVLFDAAGRLLVANRKFYDLSGYTAKETKGMHFAHFFYPEDLPVVTERFMQRMVGDDARSAFDARCVRKDGQTIQVEINSGRFAKEGTSSGIQIILRDVGERREMEKALKESEERYRTLVQNAPGITFLGGLDYTPILMHGAVEEISGYSANDFLSGKQRWDKKVHAEDVAKLRASTKKLRTVPNDSVEHEYRIMRKDGSVCWVRAVVKNACDDLGKPIRVQGVIYDITQRKEAELALKESEARYRAVVEDQTELICRWIPGGNLTFVNGSYSRYFGKKPEELIGSTFMPLIPNEDHEKVKKHFASLSAKNPVAAHEHRVIRPDGEICWMQWTNRLIFDEQGQVVEIQSVGRDITEQRKAEEALQNNEAFLSTVFTGIQDGISVLDNELNIIRANPAMEHWYAHKMPIVGKKCYDAYHGRKAPCKVCPTLRTIATGEASYEVVPKVGSDSKIVGWLDLFSFPIFDATSGQVKEIIEYVRDITERKKAEDALLESKEMYKMLVKASPDSVTVTDLEGNITYVSERTLQLYGFESTKELLGRSALERIAPKDRQRAVANMQKTLKEGSIENAQYNVLRGDGTHFIGELNAVLIRDAEGQPKAFIATVRDITERKKAKDALLESKEMYKTLVKASPDAIVLTDLEGKVTYASERAIRQFGCKNADEMLGKMYFDYVAPEDREMVLAEFRRVLEKGFVNNVQYTLVQEDGTRYFCELNGALIEDTKGQPTAVIITIRDITERKRMEEEWERLVRAIEASGDGIGILNSRAEFLFVNRALCDMLGYGPEELVGRFWSFLVPQEDVQRFRHKINTALKKDKNWKGSCEIARKDGKRIWTSFSISATGYHEGKPTGFVNIVRTFLP